jgi:hypothetical protein
MEGARWNQMPRSIVCHPSTHLWARGGARAINDHYLCFRCRSINFDAAFEILNEIYTKDWAGCPVLDLGTSPKVDGHCPMCELFNGVIYEDKRMDTVQDIL